MMANKYLKALYVAASEACENEVVQPDMEEMVIGEGKDYLSREEWIQSRLDYWLEQDIDALYEPYVASLFLQDGEYRSVLVFTLNEDDAREQIEEKFNPSKVSYVEKHKREMFQ